MDDTARRAARNSFGLWFAMVGSPFAWTAHFMLVWAITEMGCRIGLGEARSFGVYTIHALTLLSSLVTLGIIGVSGFTAYRRWRYARTHPSLETQTADSPIERTRFMGLLGVLFSVFFAVVVIFMLVPVFILPVCDI